MNPGMNPPHKSKRFAPRPGVVSRPPSPDACSQRRTPRSASAPQHHIVASHHGQATDTRPRPCLVSCVGGGVARMRSEQRNGCRQARSTGRTRKCLTRSSRLAISENGTMTYQVVNALKTTASFLPRVSHRLPGWEGAFFVASTTDRATHLDDKNTTFGSLTHYSDGRSMVAVGLHFMRSGNLKQHDTDHGQRFT
jgi:hypothetical protein